MCFNYSFSALAALEKAKTIEKFLKCRKRPCTREQQQQQKQQRRESRVCACRRPPESLASGEGLFWQMGGCFGLACLGVAMQLYIVYMYVHIHTYIYFVFYAFVLLVGSTSKTFCCVSETYEHFIILRPGCLSSSAYVSDVGPQLRWVFFVGDRPVLLIHHLHSLSLFARHF